MKEEAEKKESMISVLMRKRLGVMQGKPRIKTCKRVSPSRKKCTKKTRSLLHKKKLKKQTFISLKGDGIEMRLDAF